MKYSLSTRTSVCPDIPATGIPLLSPHLADVGAGDTFVVTIVPLSNIFGDFYRGIAMQSLACMLTVRLPGQGIVRDAEVEQLKCTLGSFAR